MEETVLMVHCTVPDTETGGKIAETLVREKLCACVNVVAGIESHYIYEGEYCRDSEAMLVIKTTAAAFDALRERIGSLHPYDLPEIVAVKVEKGNAPYLQWVRQRVK